MVFRDCRRICKYLLLLQTFDWLSVENSAKFLIAQYSIFAEITLAEKSMENQYNWKKYKVWLKERVTQECNVQSIKCSSQL